MMVSEVKGIARTTTTTTLVPSKAAKWRVPARASIFEKKKHPVPKNTFPRTSLEAPVFRNTTRPSATCKLHHPHGTAPVHSVFGHLCMVGRFTARGRRRWIRHQSRAGPVGVCTGHPRAVRPGCGGTSASLNGRRCMVVGLASPRAVSGVH